jgi:hypothetical protein
MSDAEQKLALAQAQARDAKARLDETLGALRERVDPRTLAKHAADGLREQGEAAAAVARRNPGVAGAALAAAVLLLVRRPVMSLFRRKKKPVSHTARKGAKGYSQ